ncbi:sn-glycerol-3-phosphate ABC transporter ATP-binding protein UgpC [Vibrio mimicus]
MSYVQLKNLRKQYKKNGFAAISDASFDIEKGEFVILLGPSGCGKSTLLRMIAGLEKITDGELFIDQRCVNNDLPKDRDIAMVFQSYALYPHMTVFDNMALSLKIRKINKTQIDSMVRDIAEMLHLTPFLDVKPDQLSGGQRQRVALGRAIVRRPKVFLFDEPLSNLDAKLRSKMRKEISALHKEINATIIYVTHDQVEAMTMGDKVVVLDQGNIQQIGSPKDLYDYPTNKFVASFIGSPIINFIDVEVNVDGDWIAVCSGNDFNLVLPKSQYFNLAAYHGQKVCLGIRPEDLHLVEIESSQGFEGTFDYVEYLGAECNISMTLREGKSLMLRMHNSQRIEGISKVMPNVEKIHFFNIETEQRI